VTITNLVNCNLYEQIYVYLQGPAGRVEYVLDRENSVPSDVDRYFYVSRTTGNVTLIANLRDDPNRHTVYTVTRL
jgi:hypothetical protein